MTYPIIYENSFVVFWGIFLGVGLFAGGLLTFALVAMMMLVLISHEHAHVKQCIKRHVPIRSVKFNWLGGMVDADIRYANDAVPILSAGVYDTGCYTLVFGAIIWYLDTFRVTGLDYANNPYLSLLNGIACFLIVMSITNVLPINYHHKKHGLISTDGWAALRFRELRDELWNDGKVEAHNHLVMV